MSLPYNNKLIPRAKDLRKNMTPEEKKLWYRFLSNYSIRIQRQKTIDSFIVDFYCHNAKLIIEIDGSQHYTEDGLAYDEQRTKILNAYGLEVIRISNAEINKNFDTVCQMIDAGIKNRINFGESINAKGDFSR